MLLCLEELRARLRSTSFSGIDYSSSVTQDISSGKGHLDFKKLGHESTTCNHCCKGKHGFSSACKDLLVRRRCTDRPSIICLDARLRSCNALFQFGNIIWAFLHCTCEDASSIKEL